MSYGAPTVSQGLPSRRELRGDGLSPVNHNAFRVLLRPHLDEVGYVECSTGGEPYGWAEDLRPDVQERWARSAARQVLIGFLYGEQLALSPEYAEGPFVVVATDNLRMLLGGDDNRPLDDTPDED